MEVPSVILAFIGIAIAVGALAVFFKKGGDKEASALDQNTIRAYRDSEIIMKQNIESLKTQLQTKDDIIERLVHDRKGRKKGS